MKSSSCWTATTRMITTTVNRIFMTWTEILHQRKRDCQRAKGQNQTFMKKTTSLKKREMMTKKAKFSMKAKTLSITKLLRLSHATRGKICRVLLKKLLTVMKTSLKASE